MEAYTDFAALYDEFMEYTPYDEWCDKILSILQGHGISDGLVCELGAGTGEMTKRLQTAGYDMIGIDNSEAMLAIAREKEEEGSDILYLLQDMREFELYGTVRAIVSVCDCVNYVTDPEELLKVFKLCNNYLDPEGLLVFDFNTRYKYETVIGDATIAENGEDASFIWENYYDSESSMNEYDITFFVKEEGDMYRKFTEEHFQKGYTTEEMKSLIEEAGMVFVDALDVDTMAPAGNESERVYIIAKEKGKSWKTM